MVTNATPRSRTAELPIPTSLFAYCAGFFAALAVLTCAVPSSAQGQPQPASLIVTRADGAQDCPDAAALAEQVRVIAGGNVIESGSASAPAQTWVQVAIAHEFGSYKAQISAAGARHGARTLEDVGPGCSSLADAMAVTIAIFMDPYQAARPVAQCAAVSAPPPPLPKPALLPKPTEYSRLILDGAGGVTVNVLDHSVPLVTGSVGFRLNRHWSLALGGAFVFPDRIADGSGEVELSLAYAYLSACGRALGSDDTAHIDWCVAPLLGSLRGSGHGYQNDSTEHSAWLAFSAGPELLFPMSDSWSWLLTGQAIVPLIGQGFDVQNAGARSSAFRSDAIAGLVSLGVRGNP